MRNHLVTFGLCTALLGAGCAPADQDDDGVDEVGDIASDGKADGPPTAGPLRAMEAMIAARGGGQYVEVLNDGATAVELTDYLIASKTTLRTKLKAAEGHPTAVPPGSLALIVSDEAMLKKAPSWLPAAVATTGKLGSKLKPTDTIRILDAHNTVIEQTSYKSTAMPDVSIERTAVQGGSWTPSPMGATPGSRNAALVSDNIHNCFNTPPFVDEGSCKAELLKYLGQATKKIDVAVYQANLPEYFQALIAAKQKGLSVRVVTDTSYFTGNPDYKGNYDQLAAAGITVIDDQRSALMHSKYIVIDDAMVWTGSFNFLTPRNPPKADNALWFRSVPMAKGFEEQFEQQFTQRRFGPKKVASTNTEYYVDGVRIEAYFAPKDPCEDKIAGRLSAAQQSINFAAFSFFSDSMENVMKERHAAGIDVRGIFDMTSVGPDAAYHPMLNVGIDVRTPNQLLFLHDKFLVVDENGADPTVLTGSYNFSTSAASANDESLIFVHDAALSRAYGENFRLLYLHGNGPNVEATVKLKINRVLASSMDDKNQLVEIQNIGAAAVDLAGLTISDADATVKIVALSGGATMLEAGQTAVIVNASFPKAGAPAIAVTTESGQIGDGLEPGDLIKIRGGQRGNVLDTFSYPVPLGDGVAMMRTDALDVSASWKAGK